MIGYPYSFYYALITPYAVIMIRITEMWGWEWTTKVTPFIDPVTRSVELKLQGFKPYKDGYIK